MALELDRTQFALGVTCVVFKAGQLAFLEQLTGRDLSEGDWTLWPRCVCSLSISLTLSLFSLLNVKNTLVSNRSVKCYE